MRRSRTLVSVVGLLGLVATLAAGGALVARPPAKTLSIQASTKVFKVAWIMVLDNTYTDGMLNGAKKEIKKELSKGYKVELTEFNPEFSASAQYSDVLDAIAEHKFNGILLQPNDSTSIIPALQKAIKAKIQVAVLNVPAGPNANTDKPQIAGLAGSVLTPQITWGHQMAQMTVNACKGIDPCKVGYIEGEVGSSGDVADLQGFRSGIKGHSNVDVVSVQGGGAYLAGPAQTVAQTMLVANPGMNVIVTPGDQMTHGAELAVDAAGLKGKVKLIGLGASTYGVAATKAGRWYGTVAILPGTMGQIGLQILVQHMLNPKLRSQGVNPDTDLHQSPLLTKDNIGHFQAQWAG